MRIADIRTVPYLLSTAYDAWHVPNAFQAHGDSHKVTQTSQRILAVSWNGPTGLERRLNFNGSTWPFQPFDVLKQAFMMNDVCVMCANTAAS